MKTASNVLKFVSIAVVSGFCVLAADHYCQIEKHTQDLFSKLSLTVFIDKSCPDDAQVCDEIEALGFVTVDEYVSSEDAYGRAVEKNPFLRDISVPGDREMFQSYLKISPSSSPAEDFLSAAKDAVAAVDNVAETVFNPDNFKEYARAKNLLTFYQNLLIAFAAVMAIFLIVRSVLFILESEENTRKFITGSIACLVASSIGFVGAWSACLFAQHPLIIDEIAAFYIIPITAAFGIIFKD
ncbi:MAG: hypothetical protein FWH43_03650 [Endomicrobia bacterium]|nr:hypothetical protein [Endomicrobiia bacterium]